MTKFKAKGERVWKRGREGKQTERIGEVNQYNIAALVMYRLDTIVAIGF